MVVLYSIDECQQTRATRKFLQRRGIAFEEKRGADRSGKGPYVMTEENSWTGFRPELIDVFLKGTVLH